MKGKKIITLFGAFALMMAMGVTSFAATTSSSGVDFTGGSTPAVKSAVHNRPVMTEEQKAALVVERAAKKAAMDASMEKWDSLTVAQKQTVYDLIDQEAGIKTQLVDRYLATGIIDQETADEMKAAITTNIETLKKDGKLPMLRGHDGLGGNGVKGLGGHGGHATPTQVEDDTDSTT